MGRRRLVSAIQFFRWDVTVVSGSRTDLGPLGDAAHFYGGLDIRPVSFDAALASPDPLDPPAGTSPMQPSYEDRPGAPDRVFAALDDQAFERQVLAWSRALAAAGAHEADVLHLHHLTPIHEAATRLAPRVPVVGHLHGTELLMLEEIDAGPPTGWTHAQAWADRMRAWARRCERLLLLSPSQVPRARALLGVDPDRFAVIPNGFDPAAFSPRAVDRAALWERVLVDSPRGWLPGGLPGGIRYDPADLRPLREGVTVVSVSRFTEVKRIPLLIEAFARARATARTPAGLVLVGGHPGEWEGEHPAETIARLGVTDVFLAGWYDHDDLPDLLAAADLFALASVREQFGQVLVEAMASGVPPIAVDRFGPGEIVSAGETGWLVEPDDVDALAHALREAIDDPGERARRGTRARAEAAQRYGWPALAGRFAALLETVVRPRT
jgi:glycosyltransferase involved in cell wall biosynthesis